MAPGAGRAIGADGRWRERCNARGRRRRCCARRAGRNSETNDARPFGGSGKWGAWDAWDAQENRKGKRFAKKTSFVRPNRQASQCRPRAGSRNRSSKAGVRPRTERSVHAHWPMLRSRQRMQLVRRPGSAAILPQFRARLQSRLDAAADRSWRARRLRSAGSSGSSGRSRSPGIAAREPVLSPQFRSGDWVAGRASQQSLRSLF